MFNKEGGKVKELDGVFLNHPVHIFLSTGAGALCAFVVLCHQLSQIIQMGDGRDLPLPWRMVGITYRVFSLMFSVIY